VWITFVGLSIVALFLFNRFLRYNISVPIALIISVAIVALPFILLPIFAVWLLFRMVTGSKTPLQRRPSVNVEIPSRFCPRCGADVVGDRDTCSGCGNSVRVGQ